MPSKKTDTFVRLDAIGPDLLVDQANVRAENRREVVRLIASIDPCPDEWVYNVKTKRTVSRRRVLGHLRAEHRRLSAEIDEMVHEAIFRFGPDVRARIRD